MANGNGKYVGSEHRINGGDRREYHCKHEGDLGEMKSDLKNLGSQFTSHVAEQKERNETFYTKFDGIATCLTDLSTNQELLPEKILDGMSKKRDKKLARNSTVLRNVSTAIGILVVVGGGLYWLFDFIAKNSHALP